MAMGNKRLLRSFPMTAQLGAISVGVIDGQVVVDLPYEEDSRAEVDMNLVMTGEGEFIEVQGSAEGATFSRNQLDEMLAVGETGIKQIFALQKAALEGVSL
jgi:ribonuclease PH